MIIGFWDDEPKYKPNLLCLIGLHTASKYIMEKRGKDFYFVCRRCGKRYKIANE